MILEQIAADTRLRLIEEKKLVSPEEMKEKALALAADETFPFEKMLKVPTSSPPVPTISMTSRSG